MSNDQPSGNLWSRFWFTPVPTTGLQVLRLLSGCLFAFWLLSFLGHQVSFFSRACSTRKAIAPSGATPAGKAGQPARLVGGLPGGRKRRVLKRCASASPFFFLCGRRRDAGHERTPWVAVVSFLANPRPTTGAISLGILAFHLMIGHLLLGNGTAISPFRRTDRRTISSSATNCSQRGRPAAELRRWFRHAALANTLRDDYRDSGLHKLQIGDWWSGIAYWHASSAVSRRR